MALLLAAFIAAQAVQQARRSGDEISVTGSARVWIVSDRASLSVTVSDTQNTAQATYIAVRRGPPRWARFWLHRACRRARFCAGACRLNP